MSEDVASTLLDTWVKEFSASCEAWKASHAQRSLPVPPPSANMSLLAFQHPKTTAMVVSFVRWIGVEAKPSYRRSPRAGSRPCVHEKSILNGARSSSRRL